jgi:hypothetical protein
MEQAEKLKKVGKQSVNLLMPTMPCIPPTSCYISREVGNGADSFVAHVSCGL